MKNKKGFVFTLLAFFLSLLLFSYGMYFLSGDDYTKDKTFREYRMGSLDGELKYFQEVYLPSMLSYSSYNVLGELIGNKTLLKDLNKNHSRLRALFFEGLENGTFDGNAVSSLSDKNLDYLILNYSNNFNDNFKSNFSFDIVNVNIGEKIPYYVNVQVYVKYNISSDNNLIKWQFNDSFDVSIPVYDLDDPEFVLHSNNDSIKIKPYSYFEPELNWTLESFNKTLQNFYSVFFMEADHNYLIGSSFLKRMLNVSEGSYKDVVGFWSFDYDEENENNYKLFDSSLYSENKKGHFGNSLVLYNFDNKTINFTTMEMEDLSAYNITGQFTPSINCGSTDSVYYQSCNLVSDSITISQNELNLNNTNEVSISIWVKTNSFTSQNLFSYGTDDSEFIQLQVNGTGYPQFSIGSYTFNSSKPLELNKWYNIIAVFDGDSGVGKLLINAKYVNLQLYGEYEKRTPIGSFNESSNDIKIGNFDGQIDEFALYSKALDDEEIARVFKKKKVQMIDYRDSLYGRGIEFDGVDDYVNLSTSFDLDSNYSIELWFNPNSLSNSSNRQGIMMMYGDKYLRVFLNGAGKLECDIVPGEFGNLLSDISINEWNHIVATYNGSLASLYLNSKLVDTSTDDMSINNIGEIFLSWKATDNFFNGIIDEIKIYNRSLTPEEIEMNYYNYEGIAKGCCNYITLINPNAMGYGAAYSDNVSYSTKVFFDNYNRNIKHNLTLWEIKNITSPEPSEEYYNFMVDNCLYQTFSVGSWGGTLGAPVVTGEYDYDNNGCSNMVSAGVY